MQQHVPAHQSIAMHSTDLAFLREDGEWRIMARTGASGGRPEEPFERSGLRLFDKEEA